MDYESKFSKSENITEKWMKPKWQEMPTQPIV